MRAKRFTLEAVDWESWLQPVTIDTATPAQRAALEASPQAGSAYFRTLANDVDSLAERSPLFHAVMYVPRGLKRAERELATVVTSIINGCVYCSSVHARRFVELTRQPEIIRALYEQGLDAPLEPRLRAIVDYAARLTRQPAAMTVADLAPLRAVGMSDLEIHDLTNAIAMFANANRLMQTLGEPVQPDTNAA
ncbi:MAG TPA: peroxidase-related enzyme [Acetobacteraceae bacterium]|nr:peroxidase-related enzyme [Acetobacteraceae bacterium]